MYHERETPYQRRALSARYGIRLARLTVKQPTSPAPP
mgnify:CR=1 FL=1